MTTPPLQLPFPLESGWDYIVTAEERNAADLMRSDDQWFDCDARTWRKAHAIGQPFADFNFYRRRKPASGWVRVTKETLPQVGVPLWVVISGAVSFFLFGVSEAETLYKAGYTHFRYCTDSYQIPPPPEPEREAWEVAHNQHANSIKCTPADNAYQYGKQMFQAGWDAKAKEGK